MTQMAMTQNFVWLKTDDTKSEYLEYKQFKDKKIIRAEDQERFNYTLFKGYHGLTLACRTNGVYDLYRVYDKGELILESEDEVIELPYEPKDLVIKAYDRLGEDRLVQLAISHKRIPRADSRQMKDSYKLSVVVPCYKAEKFMARTIDAILSSSLPDIQLILVNDGSPENDLEIMKWYEKNYGCVKVINQKNQGSSVTRNAGMDNADGEYLAFCDADDIPHPYEYERLYDTCKRENTDIAISSVLIRELPEKSNWYLEIDKSVVYTFDEMMQKKNTKENIYFVGVWNKIVKTDIAKKVRFPEIFAGKTFVYEDIAYTGALYSYLDKFAFCKDAIHTWDKRKRQTVGTVSTWCHNENTDWIWETFIYAAAFPIYCKSPKCSSEWNDFIHFKNIVDNYKKFGDSPIKNYWNKRLKELIDSQKLYDNKLIMANKEMKLVIDAFK